MSLFVCWSVRKFIAVLSTLAILALVCLVSRENFLPSVAKRRPSPQKLFSAFLVKNYTSTNNITKDGWVKFAEGAYGYSAYWDSRISKSRAFVRVVAITDRSASTITNLKCRVRVGKGEDEGVMLFDFIDEHHEKKHAALMINCIPRKLAAVPELISIFPASESTNKRWIPIKRVEQGTKKGKMAVCVRPLFGPFDKTYSLAGFISFYLAIGASHFLFYSQNISRDVKDYLAVLSRKISLDVLPWNIPSRVGDAWAHGQLASIQDCIYRNMYLFDYVLIVDLDEYIVPKRHYSLQDTINSFTARNPAKPLGAFVIRNAFFCVNDSSQNSIVFLNNTRRLNSITPAMLRSKVIVKPEAVVISKIHSVQKMLGRWLQVVLPVEFAVLQHYRLYGCQENSSFSWGNSSYLVEDRSVLKYSKDVFDSLPLRIWKDTFL